MIDLHSKILRTSWGRTVTTRQEWNARGSFEQLLCCVLWARNRSERLVCAKFRNLSRPNAWSRKDRVRSIIRTCSCSVQLDKWDFACVMGKSYILIDDKYWQIFIASCSSTTFHLFSSTSTASESGNFFLFWFWVAKLSSLVYSSMENCYVAADCNWLAFKPFFKSDFSGKNVSKAFGSVVLSSNQFSISFINISSEITWQNTRYQKF